MMKVTGKLVSAVSLPGRGQIKPGMVTGDYDGSVVWVTHNGRRLGVPVSRFAALEEAGTAPVLSQEQQEAQIRIKAARGGKDINAAVEAFRAKQRADLRAAAAKSIGDEALAAVPAIVEARTDAKAEAIAKLERSQRAKDAWAKRRAQEVTP